MSTIYRNAADLRRAILDAAAHAPADACASGLPDWRPADPEEAAEFLEFPPDSVARTWTDGAWRVHLRPERIREALPRVAMHGPTRPAADKLPRAVFRFTTGPGSVSSVAVVRTAPRLAELAETVRKRWALFGGGAKPEEIKPRQAPRRAEWSPAIFKAWRLQLQDADHVGAMLTGERIGARYYPGGGERGCFALAAPVQVQGMPAGLCSFLRDDGRWIVADEVSGLAVGDSAASRRAAEAGALQRWADASEEKRARAIESARRTPPDMAAARAAWCKAYSIADPAAPAALAEDPAPAADLAATPAAEVAPDAGRTFASDEAAERAAAAAAREPCAFVDRLLQRMAARRAADPAPAPAAPAAPAAPLAAAPTPPDSTSREGAPDSTSREGAPDSTSREGAPDSTSREGAPDSTSRETIDAAPAWQILAARPLATYCTPVRRIGVHEWATLVYVDEVWGACTDHVWRRVDSARFGGPYEGGRFQRARDWPAYDGNDTYSGLPRSLGGLYEAHRAEIGAALDSIRAGQLPDWAGPQHAEALQSARQAEERRAANLARLAAAAPRPAVAAPAADAAVQAAALGAGAGAPSAPIADAPIRTDRAETARAAAPAWFALPRAAVYRAHVATAAIACALYPEPCGPCEDNPRQWLRARSGPESRRPEVQNMRTEVAAAVRLARAGHPVQLAPLDKAEARRLADMRPPAELRERARAMSGQALRVATDPHGAGPSWAAKVAAASWARAAVYREAARLADMAAPPPTPYHPKPAHLLTLAQYLALQPAHYAPMLRPAHRREVARALERGETLPAAVLADYPDLAPPDPGPTLADLRAANDVATTLAGAVCAAAPPERAPAMLGAEAARLRASAESAPPGIAARWRLAADMLQVLAGGPETGGAPPGRRDAGPPRPGPGRPAAGAPTPRSAPIVQLADWRAGQGPGGAPAGGRLPRLGRPGAAGPPCGGLPVGAAAPPSAPIVQGPGGGLP